MRKGSYAVLLLPVLLGFGLARNVPTATRPGAYSTVSGRAYNSEAGLPVEPYEGLDEAKVAKQQYNPLKLLEFNPTGSADLLRERELAYQYYSHIPGVVWIDRNLYIDETEVANIHWLEFRRATGRGPQRTFPGMPADYASNPKFRFYPVVGVSYQDAQAFCAWRSEVVTQAYNEKKGYQPADKDYAVFRFRLPSEAEWGKCAAGGLDTRRYPHGFTALKAPVKFSAVAGAYLAPLTRQGLAAAALQQRLDAFTKNKEQDYLVNCRRDEHAFLNLTVPLQVWSNPANQFGIYNLLGNVAEMLSAEGMAAGGSWLDLLDACRLDSRQHYDGPQANLGFRYVCTFERPDQP
ncbi:formylglycine-generating enzyme family protein [Hymenobacter sp. 15J16-1T3B]|uniref:formylglycine-generating enzyme family protein n=1 Tax=Hymenobacter sp. 15J16-1T3B TaxID=2886941 RepID=UPI001D103BA6|nr:SUMF1/EgtB/PvdO family nonheme iron enzyme [Hymenobacter sp. 15J16-1T3B]MCC3159215.1 formylglycine-generating enzyme family protein [Hymenobacter sp. 15J16-1T3B]